MLVDLLADKAREEILATPRTAERADPRPDRTSHAAPCGL
jgi:hypothetical protein